MDKSSESSQSSSKPSCSDQVTNMSSNQKESKTYWQVGKRLERSLLNMYENKQWTDVVFRCKKSLDDNATERLPAHRNILAARSPVFEAMLYGTFAKDEIELEDVESEIFDLVLRFVYTDATLLSDENAVKVLEIAHRYMLTPLVNYCASYLYSILKPDNVCAMLELAVQYDLKTFRSKILNFMDDNAPEVLKSDGFLTVSQQCLVHILERDTFNVNEMNIVERAIQWADGKCNENGIEATARNKREVLGEAFFQLRMTSLEMKDFLRFTRRNSYYTKEETEDICASIVGECEITSSIHNLIPRIPRKAIRLVPDKEVYTGSEHYVNKIKCVVEAKVSRKIYIQGLALKNVLPYIESAEKDSLYGGYRERNKQAANTPLPLYGKFTLEDCNRNIQLIVKPSEKNNTVTFKKILPVQPREQPYRMVIELSYGCNSSVVLQSTPSKYAIQKVSIPKHDSTSSQERENATKTTGVLFTYSDISEHLNCIESFSIINIPYRGVT